MVLEAERYVHITLPTDDDYLWRICEEMITDRISLDDIPQDITQDIPQDIPQDIGNGSPESSLVPEEDTPKSVLKSVRRLGTTPKAKHLANDFRFRISGLESRAMSKLYSSPQTQSSQDSTNIGSAPSNVEPNSSKWGHTRFGNADGTPTSSVRP